jgi:hypothetical protein
MNLITGLILDSIQSQKEIEHDEKEKLNEILLEEKKELEKSNGNTENELEEIKDTPETKVINENSSIHEILGYIKDRVKIIENKTK